MMKASDAVAQVLADNNVLHGFELIGGMITHLVDSINQLGKTKLVSMHHEQGAAFAATAVARATNHDVLGVALGTSGPGATNLITGIADCWLDGHPCVFLTGQVNTHELKGDRPIRQQGFQELDSVALVSSITKYAYQIQHVDELIPCLKKAIAIAREGRPGPVLLDIPMDIQRQEVPDSVINSAYEKPGVEQVQSTDPVIQLVLNKLMTAQRPLILIGGGAVNTANFSRWISCVDALQIPYVTSLKGAEKVVQSDCYLGMLGAYGTRVANFAVQNCDLLLVLGSRMDVRQTGAKAEDFAREAEIVQLDLEGGQLNNRIKTDVAIKIELSDFFEKFMASNLPQNDAMEVWKTQLKVNQERLSIDEYKDWSVSPFALFTILNQKTKGIALDYVADVGNNQMWAAHTLKLSAGQAVHYSGGLGAMGFAIPAAIGVSCATQRPVIVITGDGGAQLNIQELDIIARDKLPVLTIVMNNHSLGMVRGFQEMYFEGRNSSTYWNGYTTQFKALGEAYGLYSIAVKTVVDFAAAVQKFVDKPVPMLLEVEMPDARECRPRLEYGNPLDKQTPMLNKK